jgi:hypothetical protein
MDPLILLGALAIVIGVVGFVVLVKGRQRKAARAQKSSPEQ